MPHRAMTSSNNQIAVVYKELGNQGFEIKDNIILACNGLGLRNMLQSGQKWLKVHVNIVNSLNVFPVPDGDTGTNMLLTMRAVSQAMEMVTEPNNVANIAGAAAHGALMGARGNSGVILSQFLQGLAQGLEGQPLFTAAELAVAIQLGVEKAYQSVVTPVEGTILTVARAAAEAVQQSAETNNNLVIVLTDMLEAAKIAQAKTPTLLPILKEAGVTDSGGQGLVYILEGALRFIHNQPVNIDPVTEIGPLLQPALSIEEEDYGYDLQFLITGEQLDVGKIRTQLETMGWSTLVVGDKQVVKVHIHTLDPGPSLSYGVSQGKISDVVVENMTEQARLFMNERSLESLPATHPLVMAAFGAREVEQQTADVTAILVAPGQGLTRIFQSLGAGHVLAGGQSQNPSTEELLTAINQVSSPEVLILPNNQNLILTAQQAKILARKRVEVVPTKTVPQGVAALLAFNTQANLDTNARRMFEASQQVQTIEVTHAVHTRAFSPFNIKVGDVMGLLNGELVSVGKTYKGVVLDSLSKIEIELYEIMTIYFGKESSSAQAKALAHTINELNLNLEVEVYEGGQPHYHYIISLE